MQKYYPVTICQARYGGTYEGAAWLCFDVDPVSFTAEVNCEDAFGSDIECSEWWSKNGHEVGTGNTPNEAYDALCNMLDEHYGAQLWDETETSFVGFNQFRQSIEPWVTVERDGMQRTVTISYSQASSEKITGFDGVWEEDSGHRKGIQHFLSCIHNCVNRRPLDAHRTQEI